ncbi:hypothetical protein D3C81_904450 [compost metagenome]
MAAGVEHEHIGAGHGAADRDRAPDWPIAADRIKGRKGGVFGRTIAVDNGDLLELVVQAAHDRRRNDLAAGEHVAQARQRTVELFDPLLEQRGRQPHGVDSFTLDESGQFHQVEHTIGIDGERAAIEQRPPDLQRRGVESDGGQLQHDGVGVERHVVGAPHQAEDRTRRDGHALGRAGGARGVHQVSEPFRIGRRRRERSRHPRAQGVERDGGARAAVQASQQTAVRHQ